MYKIVRKKKSVVKWKWKLRKLSFEMMLTFSGYDFVLVWKLKFLLHGYLKVCSSNVSLQFYPSAGIKLFLKVFLFLYLFAVNAHKVFAVDDSFYLFCKGFFNI